MAHLDVSRRDDAEPSAGYVRGPDAVELYALAVRPLQELLVRLHLGPSALEDAAGEEKKGC